MIKDLITYFKFTKHVPLFKLYIGISVLFIIYGFMFLCFGTDNHFVTTLQLTMGLNYTTLIVGSAIFNDMVGASPMRRFFEITVPDIFSVVSGIMVYIILAIAMVIYLNNEDTTLADVTESFISGAFGVAFTLIFLACMYKHLIIGSIIIGIAMTVSFICSIFEYSIITTTTLPELYIMSAVIVIIGVALSIILRHSFEKHSYMSIYEKQAAKA